MIHDGVELPTLLTIDEAADVLGLTAEAIHRRIASGTLTTVRVQGTLRVLTESIVDRSGEPTLCRPNRDVDREPLELQDPEIER